jgi:hypothetical protein
LIDSAGAATGCLRTRTFVVTTTFAVNSTFGGGRCIDRLVDQATRVEDYPVRDFATSAEARLLPGDPYSLDADRTVRPATSSGEAAPALPSTTIRPISSTPEVLL